MKLRQHCLNLDSVNNQQSKQKPILCEPHGYWLPDHLVLR